MSSESSPERRLAQVEARLERLESLHEEARRDETRQRRRERWTRVAILLIVGVAYVLYLRYVTSIG